MGDSWEELFGYHAGDPQRIEKIYGGRRLVIHLDRVREVLPIVAGSYDGDASADHGAQSCLSEDFPTVDIREKAPTFSSYGKIFNTVSRPIAWYQGFSGWRSKKIEIFAEPLLEFRELFASSALRDNGFSSITDQQYFAFIVAHEFRHWIQHTTGWLGESRQRASSGRRWERLFKIAPMLMPSIFSTLFALVVSVGVWKFLLAPGAEEGALPAILFSATNFVLAFLLSFVSCVRLQNANGSGKRSGRIYAACARIDQIYLRFVYRLYPIERDADDFAAAAIKNQRWVDVVSIEKI